MLHRNKSGLTLLELLVTIAIIAVLVALTAVMMPGVRQRSEQVACVANLRAIYPAFQMYLSDNNMRLPWRYQPDEEPPVAYKDDLEPYIDGRMEAFVCPSHATIDFPAQASYGINYFYDHVVTLRIENPAHTILLAETEGGRKTGSHRAHRDSEHPGELAPERHKGRSNYLFFDGSVRTMDHAHTLAPKDLWGDNLRESDADSPQQ